MNEPIVTEEKKRKRTRKPKDALKWTIAAEKKALRSLEAFRNALQEPLKVDRNVVLKIKSILETYILEIEDWDSKHQKALAVFNGK